MPLRGDIQKKQYASGDEAVKASSIFTSFPVISHIDACFKNDNELNIILLAKTSGYDKSRENIEKFKEELNNVIKPENDVKIHIVKSDFKVDAEIYEKTVNELVKHIPDNSYIISDITYGPKDAPLIIYTAIQLAVKYLDCELGSIIYGLGYFDENENLQETKLCDMGCLFSMLSLTDIMKPTDTGMARKIIEKISDL